MQSNEISNEKLTEMIAEQKRWLENEEREEKEANRLKGYLVDSDYNQYISKRIEIPVHYDTWTRGAKFGTVTGYRRGEPGISDCLIVKMDHPQIKKSLKLWRHDWEYAKLV